MADRVDAVMDLAKRRGFLWPAFESYGGAAGFYDFGPYGATMKRRVEELWRRIFVLEEPLPMGEVYCPRVTIHDVLKASGHVDEFTDLVVRCKNGHPSRADHLVEEAGFDGNADALDAAAIDKAIKNLGPKCPVCNNRDFDEAHPQNLMFQTEIGPGSGRVGYLRPETAQGIFTDFPHLLRHARGKLPFGAIQIGGSNRNEISPRQGMIRLREFNMMEAEVFFDPDQKDHPHFDRVADQEAPLVPDGAGAPIHTTFGKAVEDGTIANKALAYFMARTQTFLLQAGMDPDRVRFRQHLKDEMAHYASDCWDAEYHSERYGWVECVGIADRGCYDLTQHAVHSGRPTKHPVTDAEGYMANQEYSVAFRIDPPIRFQAERNIPVMGQLGRTFKAQAKVIAHKMEEDFLATCRDAGLADAAWPDGTDLYQLQCDSTAAPAEIPLQLDVDGETITVPPEAYQVQSGNWSVAAARKVPHVIEPSFGLDRILWGIWEHAYEQTKKEGEPYTRMRFTPQAAPVQVAILPLTSKGTLPKKADEIDWMLRGAGYLTETDLAGNIGRRYARQDEVGTPYCVTVDNETLEDDAVTLRERDSTEQERIRVDGLVDALRDRFQ